MIQEISLSNNNLVCDIAYDINAILNKWILSCKFFMEKAINTDEF